MNKKKQKTKTLFKKTQQKNKETNKKRCNKK